MSTNGENQVSTEQEKKEHVHVHGPNCSHGHQSVEQVKRTLPKVGRNDPCLCGSEKKYKKCCGK